MGLTLSSGRARGAHWQQLFARAGIGAVLGRRAVRVAGATALAQLGLTVAGAGAALLCVGTRAIAHG